MGIALLSSERSKDPNTCVGACIVNSDNKILSMGYNGAPTGLSDDIMPWGRDGDTMNTKYAYVCHSELNAILNCPTSVKGSRLYVTLFPAFCGAFFSNDVFVVESTYFNDPSLFF